MQVTRCANTAQLARARRYPHQTAMRHLQQPGRQRLPPPLLRTSHLRELYAPCRPLSASPPTNLGPGQQNLPPSCPVCEHSPLTAEDCNPNKSLRTTIRVFLRTEEKKRETSRPKETKDSTPATPVEATKPQLPAPESTPQEEVVTQDEDAHVTAAEAGPRSGSEAAQDPAQGPDQV